MDLLDHLINFISAVYRRRMSRKDDASLPIQSGVLPWRVKRKKTEVMLVTGRRSKRWMIAKGWPMDGMSLADSAAQEAFEEAGIKGKVDATPIGSFRFVKQHLLFGDVEVRIQVHPMIVKRELADWPERAERSRKWFELSDAVEQVDSDELKALIVAFGDGLKAQSKVKKGAAA